MLDSVAKMIKDLRKEFDGEAVTPAGVDLFRLMRICQKLTRKERNYIIRIPQDIVHMQKGKARSTDNGVIFVQKGKGLS
jgi:hypothetical protein